MYVYSASCSLTDLCLRAFLITWGEKLKLQFRMTFRLEASSRYGSYILSLWHYLIDPPCGHQQQSAGTGPSGGSTSVTASSRARDPQSRQFRQQLLQNPEPLLNYLAVEHPEMAQTLAANPEMLRRVLADDSSPIDDSESTESSSDAQTISVTGEEKAALDRVSHILPLGTICVCQLSFSAGSSWIPSYSRDTGILCL